MKPSKPAIPLMIVMLAAAAAALTIEYAADPTTPVASIHAVVMQRPSSEPCAAFTLAFDQGAGFTCTQILAGAPGSGCWSQVAPILTHTDSALSLTALAPAFLRLTDTAGIPVMLLDITVDPKITPGELFSHAKISQAFGADGRTMTLPSLSSTAVSRTTIAAATTGEISTRIVGRIHTLSFHLIKQMSVTATVFDAQGKIVRTLAKSVLPAGMHTVVWDQTTSAGRLVGTGFYFVRLQTGTSVFSKKVRIVR